MVCDCRRDEGFPREKGDYYRLSVYERLPVASSDIVPCAIEHETSIVLGSSADAAKRKAPSGV